MVLQNCSPSSNWLAEASLKQETFPYSFIHPSIFSRSFLLVRVEVDPESLWMLGIQCQALSIELDSTS